MRIKTFAKGGVHPEENKISAKEPINQLSLPKSVVIHLSQHIGASSTAIVAKGDKVKVGQLIAKGSGYISANIHSSVSGTVSKIDALPDQSGFKKEAIVIDVEGDEWSEKIDRSDTINSSIEIDPKAILVKITEAGIVGLGGATFPTQVKLSPPPTSKAEVLLINGVECEPYLTADHRLMLEKGEEIIIGAKLIMKVLGVKKGVIGIENNKLDAIEHLTKIAQNHNEIEICALKVKYPQGGEKQLIKAVTGREVKSGALPISQGTVVCNVGTAFAVYEAVQKNKPLFERVVTVTGKEVQKPANFKVRIGTPISHLIDSVGGVPENTEKIISGGPMMGKAIPTINAPVSKGTSGILLLKKEEAHRTPMNDCIRCARCVSVCPMGLEPYLLMTLSEKKIWDRLEFEKVVDCIECGSCNFICPANRSILDYVRLGKHTITKLARARKS